MILFLSWSQTSLLESQGGVHHRRRSQVRRQKSVSDLESFLLHENAAMTFSHIICYHIINFTSSDLWNMAPPDIHSKCQGKDSLGDL